MFHEHEQDKGTVQYSMALGWYGKILLHRGNHPN
jgi:hypothetical protein